MAAGIFGAGVVKIGLTRRLEPLDRVSELGDASVPFRFDVHALYFSEDAVTLENQLHQAFADRTLNRANARKEFSSRVPWRFEQSSRKRSGTSSSSTNTVRPPSTSNRSARGQPTSRPPVHEFRSRRLLSM